MDGESYIRGLSDTELQRLITLDYDRYSEQELDIARDEQRRRAKSAAASTPRAEPAAEPLPTAEPIAAKEPARVEERRPPAEPPFWETPPASRSARKPIRTPPADPGGYESSDGDEVRIGPSTTAVKTVLAIVVGILFIILKFCARQ